MSLMDTLKGWFGKAATAGLGVRLDASGNLNSTDLAALGGSISGSRIASNPNSENCGQCHARNEGFGSSIPVPGNSAVGGMKLGYGVYWRREAANTQFDIDKITAAGACGSGDCSNSTLWSEFGCKTGMGIGYLRWLQHVYHGFHVDDQCHDHGQLGILLNAFGAGNVRCAEPGKRRQNYDRHWSTDPEQDA